MPVRQCRTADIRIIGTFPAVPAGSLRSREILSRTANGGHAVRALDTAAVREWAAACVHSLEALRTDIDGINVYPVADSDTGSNLLHTVAAAHTALAAEQQLTGAGAALAVLAREAVRTARGNSGVILSQILRGIAESAGDADELDGPALAAALRDANRMAWQAVAHPIEGTMLSVLDAVAAAVGDDLLDDVVTAAAKAAADALADTPNQLPVLAAAGVVDAGGRGLVAVLDALADVVRGRDSIPRPAFGPPPPARSALRTWEVMYLLSDLSEAALPALRDSLSELGDSVTVAGDGDGDYMVHVHCADIGVAIEAGLHYGRPRDIRVEPLVTPEPAHRGSGSGDRGVVAVVHGDALAGLIDAEGVPVLVVPEDTRPSSAELLGLILGTGARDVVVVPGSPALAAVAERLCGHPRLAGHDVVVIPCASPVQVLAALAVHDPGRRAGPDAVAMAEAAAATRRGDLLVAEEESITWVGRAQAGEAVGLVDDEVVLIESGDRIPEAATALLERMLAVGGELVTVLTGSDAPEGITDVIAEWLRAEHPEVELVCYFGGQTDTLLVIGVE